jgi:outer membrane protein assembly factor BamB
MNIEHTAVIMKYIAAQILVFLAVSMWSCGSKEQQVHEWRGPDRTGVYREAGLLKEWPEDGPVLALYAEGIGNGFGSPVIAGEQLFITGEIDSTAILYCFDLNGNILWQTILGKEWVRGYPGSRSAPTVVGELLYVGTGMGDLFCVDINDGKILWIKKFSEDFNGIPTLHGHSEAPVVHEHMVFWTPGGKTCNVVALDRFTGKVIWSNPGFSERSGYNQPKLIELPGRDLFVTFSAYHLMGFDAETGELLWSQEQESYPPEERQPGYGDTHANTVLYEDGSIYYVAGDGNCGVRLDLSKNGSEIKEIWRNKELDGYMGGVVYNDGFLYCGTTVKKTLVSVDVSSGQVVDSLEAGSGAVIAADGMLIYYNQQGRLLLISYNKGKMKEISSFKVARGNGPHFSHPVIDRGVLYLRHGDALMGYLISS